VPWRTSGERRRCGVLLRGAARSECIAVIDSQHAKIVIVLEDEANLAILLATQFK